MNPGSGHQIVRNKGGVIKGDSNKRFNLKIFSVCSGVPKGHKSGQRENGYFFNILVFSCFMT